MRTDLKLDFAPGFPREIHDALEPIVMKYLWLLPGWVGCLKLDWAETRTVFAEVEYCHRNRWAVITVGMQWISKDQHDRERAIVHELIHIALAPLAAATSNIIDTMEGGVAEKLAREMFTEGMECSVEDLALAILRSGR